MTVKSDNSQVSIAVVGAGAFGRNHARVYHELQKEGRGLQLVAVVDTDPLRADAVAGLFGARAFRSVREMLDNTSVDAASVAVPTVHHAAVARELLEAGVDVLIEKPLAPALADADAIIRAAGDSRRVAQVGHLERFNPAVRAALPLITEPMFFEVHRLSPFGPRALDVDVVLDLMIHDLDIVLSFVHSPIKEVRAVGLPILSGKVDIANVRLEFESGCVANFTASRVSTERVRKVRFFQPRQYISIDYSRQDVLVISVDPQFQEAAAARAEARDIRTGVFNFAQAMRELEARERHAATPARPSAEIPPQFLIHKPPVEQEEPLKAEIESFLEAVRRLIVPVVSLDDGRRALAAALDIQSAIEAHAQVVNLRSARP
ncbi:MAG: Gfo/Idh/MocA family protein [Terriglobales bacterium]